MDSEILANKITASRTRRGWTVYAMCKRMEGVGEGTVRNLEGREVTRNTAGSDVKLRTAIEICTVLWPDVQLHDFLGQGQALLRLVPPDKRARKRIEIKQAS